MATRCKRILPSGPADPYQVLAAFFENYELEDYQLTLWDLLMAALSNPNAKVWHRADRNSVLTLCQHLDKLIKAAAMIYEGQNASTKD